MSEQMQYAMEQQRAQEQEVRNAHELASRRMKQEQKRHDEIEYGYKEEAQ